MKKVMLVLAVVLGMMLTSCGGGGRVGVIKYSYLDTQSSQYCADMIVVQTSEVADIFDAERFIKKSVLNRTPYDSLIVTYSIERVREVSR